MILKEILSDAIKAHYSYLESCERDITERHRLIVQTEVLTKYLHANRVIMNEYQ